MSASSVVRVIYLAGAGRSGSTWLDTVLGAHPQVVAVGELSKLIPNGWLGAEYCACGKRAPDCPFWTEVRERWLPAAPSSHLATLHAEQLAFERSRHWGRLLAERRSPSRRFERYREAMLGLYRAVAESAGRPVVVDSSKTPLRALALAGTPGLDLVVVHLVRDARGVAWSYRKSFARDEQAGIQHDIAPQGAGRTALAWILVNLQTEWLRRLLPEGASLRLRYEELMRAPGCELGRLGNLAGLDLGGVAAALERGQELPVGHTIAGNLLRMKGSVRLAPDFAWTSRLPPRERAKVERLAGWMLAAYGYPRHAAGGEGEGL
ncbi:MAG TPA: sulfotransferase [Thermoanaerobaculia bacterium]|nr:sulfotransferase [Thermoanaerobaculia bacterium]